MAQTPNNVQFPMAKSKGDIAFNCRVPANSVTSSVINQSVRSASSVSGSYCEADDAESTKDVRRTISICLKKAKKTLYRLRMIAVAAPRVLRTSPRTVQSGQATQFDFRIDQTLDQAKGKKVLTRFKNWSLDLGIHFGLGPSATGI